MSASLVRRAPSGEVLSSALPKCRISSACGVRLRLHITSPEQHVAAMHAWVAAFRTYVHNRPRRRRRASQGGGRPCARAHLGECGGRGAGDVESMCANGRLILCVTLPRPTVNITKPECTGALQTNRLVPTHRHHVYRNGYRLTSRLEEPCARGGTESAEMRCNQHSALQRSGPSGAGALGLLPQGDRQRDGGGEQRRS